MQVMNTLGVYYDKNDYMEFISMLKDNIYFINNEYTQYYLNELNFIVIGYHDSIYDILSYFMEYIIYDNLKLPHDIKDIVYFYLEILGGRYILNNINILDINCYGVHEQNSNFKGAYITPLQFKNIILDYFNYYDIQNIKLIGNKFYFNKIELFYTIYEYFNMSYEYYQDSNCINFIHSIINNDIISDYYPQLFIYCNDDELNYSY